MEKAGVPLRKSLEAARDDSEGAAVRRFLADAASQVKAGRTLAEAMARYPYLFDAATAHLIAAGEKSGKMSRVLASCRAHYQRIDDHTRKMKKALLYPKITAVIVLGLACLRGNTGLPYMVGGFLFFALLLVAARKYVFAVRDVTDRILVAIPGIGHIVAADSWARYAEALAMLYEAGVPLRDALGVAAQCVPNAAIRAAAEDAVPRVQAGQSLHQAFAAGGLVDKLTLSMLRTGEASGNLGHTLREVSSWHDKRTDDALTRLHQTAGPALILFLGAVFYQGL